MSLSLINICRVCLIKPCHKFDAIIHQFLFMPAQQTIRYAQPDVSGQYTKGNIDIGPAVWPPLPANLIYKYVSQLAPNATSSAIHFSLSACLVLLVHLKHPLKSIRKWATISNYFAVFSHDCPVDNFFLVADVQIFKLLTKMISKLSQRRQWGWWRTQQSKAEELIPRSNENVVEYLVYSFHFDEIALWLIRLPSGRPFGKHRVLFAYEK